MSLFAILLVLSANSDKSLEAGVFHWGSVYLLKSNLNDVRSIFGPSRTFRNSHFPVDKICYRHPASNLNVVFESSVVVEGQGISSVVVAKELDSSFVCNHTDFDFSNVKFFDEVRVGDKRQKTLDSLSKLGMKPDEKSLVYRKTIEKGSKQYDLYVAAKFANDILTHFQIAEIEDN